MNKHIVAMIHPFVMEQEVSVYDNGECIKNIKCSLDDVEDTIFALANQFETKQIDLGGNQMYNLKIKDTLSTSTKYNKNELNITVH